MLYKLRCPSYGLQFVLPIVACTEVIVHLDAACRDYGGAVVIQALYDRLYDAHVTAHLALDDDLCGFFEVIAVFLDELTHILNVVRWDVATVWYETHAVP